MPSREELLNKTAIIGVTYQKLDGNRIHRVQFHGHITAVEEGRAVTLTSPKGEILTFPPILDAFEPAEPGEYTLKSTGEVVIDPDLTAAFTVTLNAEQ